MRITPNLNDRDYASGFKADIFHKADLAAQMTALLEGIDHGTVSILDGRWGSGKTVFSRQWKAKLEEGGVPCIYVDVFSIDYMSDPFRAITSAFVKAAKESQTYDPAAYNEFLKAAAKATRLIAGPLAKVAVKAATFGLLAHSEIDQITQALNTLGDDLGTAADSAIERLLEEEADEEATLKALSESLTSLPKLLAKKFGHSEQVDKPLIVIIDELDRCRPDFALGVLEALKHFFRVDGIHFVVVTNLRYVELSVAKRYGLSDAASEYLHKFYDFVIDFERNSNPSEIKPAPIHAKNLFAILKPDWETTGSELINAVVDSVAAFNLSLRETEKVVTVLAITNIEFSSHKYRPESLIAFLLCLKVKHPTVYQSIKRGSAEFADIFKIFEDKKWNSAYRSERIKESLIYHFIDDQAFQSREPYTYSGYVRKFNFTDRNSALLYLISNYIEPFG